MDDTIGEKKPLLGNIELNLTKCISEIRVYRSRWWVTFILVYSAVLSGMMWNTYGIIADSTAYLFAWTNGDLGIISNVTNVTFIAAVIPVSILMDTKGLKISTIGCVFLLFIGCGMRCFTLDPGVFFAVSCVTAGLVGIASILPYAGPALVASTWFPPHQRSLISGIIAFCNYIGGSMAFIIVPQLVPGPVFRHTNSGIIYSANSTAGDLSGDIFNSSVQNMDETANSHDNILDNLDEMRTGMFHLMYLFAASAALLLLCTLVHFPAKPPSPPSFSASVPRTDYKRAVIDIMKNKQHWIIIIAASLPRGIGASWVSVFDIPARSVGISQVNAGMIAFCSTFIGALSGLLFSRLSYWLDGRSKGLVLSVSVIGTLFSVWAALLFTKVIETNLPSLYMSNIIVGILTYGTTPLFYEMSAEAAFPVGEGVAGGLYTLVLHLLSSFYLAAMSIPNIGEKWMTWAVVCALALSVPLLAVFKERNKRSELDKTAIIF